MSKAFTKETEQEDDDDGEDAASPLPAGSKNYITPGGHQRLKDEFQYLLKKDRPAVTAAVSWAAKNGDRSENADYQYGKKRLREIDRRIRFLIKRLEIAEVVDSGGQDQDRVFFGTTVSVRDGAGQERSLSIVGMDEVDPARGRVSWVSPIARALLKAREGDSVSLRTPSGVEQLEVVEIRYLDLP